jgi:hypothetical protein
VIRSIGQANSWNPRFLVHSHCIKFPLSDHDCFVILRQRCEAEQTLEVGSRRHELLPVLVVSAYRPYLHLNYFEFVVFEDFGLLGDRLWLSPVLVPLLLGLGRVQWVVHGVEPAELLGVVPELLLAHPDPVDLEDLLRDASEGRLLQGGQEPVDFRVNLFFHVDEVVVRLFHIVPVGRLLLLLVMENFPLVLGRVVHGPGGVPDQLCQAFSIESLHCFILEIVKVPCLLTSEALVTTC